MVAVLFLFGTSCCATYHTKPFINIDFFFAFLVSAIKANLMKLFTFSSIRLFSNERPPYDTFETETLLECVLSINSHDVASV